MRPAQDKVAHQLEGAMGVDISLRWRAVELSPRLPTTDPTLPLVAQPDVPYRWHTLDRCVRCGKARELGQRHACGYCGYSQYIQAQLSRALWS